VWCLLYYTILEWIWNICSSDRGSYNAACRLSWLYSECNYLNFPTDSPISCYHSMSICPCPSLSWQTATSALKQFHSLQAIFTFRFLLSIFFRNIERKAFPAETCACFFQEYCAVTHIDFVIRPGSYNSAKHGNLREFFNSGKFREVEIYSGNSCISDAIFSWRNLKLTTSRHVSLISYSLCDAFFTTQYWNESEIQAWQKYVTMLFKNM